LRQQDKILKKQEKEMSKSNLYNSAIKCSVPECENNQGAKGYCTLESIEIGTHEFYPTQQQCTDCQSFQLRSTLTAQNYMPQKQSQKKKAK
jgi:hypothetical protein